jgi:hypothetical protein
VGYARPWTRLGRSTRLSCGRRRRSGNAERPSWAIHKHSPPPDSGKENGVPHDYGARTEALGEPVRADDVMESLVRVGQLTEPPGKTVSGQTRGLC